MLKELCEINYPWIDKRNMKDLLKTEDGGDALYIARVRSWYRRPYSNLSAFLRMPCVISKV